MPDVVHPTADDSVPVPTFHAYLTSVAGQAQDPVRSSSGGRGYDDLAAELLEVLWDSKCLEACVGVLGEVPPRCESGRRILPGVPPLPVYSVKLVHAFVG